MGAGGLRRAMPSERGLSLGLTASEMVLTVPRCRHIVSIHNVCHPVFFLGTLFLGFIGPDAVDYVKMPLGVNLAVGDVYGSGQVVMHDGNR